MKIAVLSGKGGTGKTTVAAGMAASLPACQYVDCDVEEPNGALFLKPDLVRAIPVKVPVPVVDEAKCAGCGLCAKICRFHALAVTKGKVLLFPELCHHCGACRIACPLKAISEADREIGVIESDREGCFMQGKLNIGEPVAVPVVRELKRRIRPDVPAVLDCPPGASCTVAAVIEGCDACLLVTEPTPFGLHDLKIAAALVRRMGIPLGAVINKATGADGEARRYCAENRIPVLMEIPFSRTIAENYSRGLLPVHTDPLWRDRFIRLYEALEKEAGA